MRPLAALLAAAALCCGSATASSCRVDPAPAPGEVAQQLWRELAEFAFLVGRDTVDDAGAMTLAKTLQRMPAFAALQTAAAHWGTLRADSDALGDSMARLAPLVGRLQPLCDQLDAIALDPAAPLDAARWNASVAAIGVEMDAAIAAAAPTVAQLENYATLLRAAAAHYARQPPPPNPVIRIGPAPEHIAAGFSAVAWRWRANAADLVHARKILPLQPVRGSSAPLIAMTAAMRELARIAAEARALSAQRLAGTQFRRYDTGNYLYDLCPMLKDRQWVRLQNRYWSEKLATASVLNGLGHILPPGPGTTPMMRKGADSWQFIRTGKGYWLIQNAASIPAAMALDVTSVAGQARYQVTMTGSGANFPNFSGQQWRCAPSDRPGQFHLYNRFLSEAIALDTYNNNGVAVMLPTGHYSGQYWRAIAP